MSMFGDKKETNPEGEVGVGVDVEATLTSTENKDDVTEVPAPIMTMRGENEFPSESQSLQTVVKTTLEDFFSAIERVGRATVELDKIAIEAESRIRSN